jgi:hypothetical protein
MKLMQLERSKTELKRRNYWLSNILELFLYLKIIFQILICLYIVYEARVLFFYKLRGLFEKIKT